MQYNPQYLTLPYLLGVKRSLLVSSFPTYHEEIQVQRVAEKSLAYHHGQEVPLLCLRKRQDMLVWISDMTI
jgi:hypothetical protein